jgi:phage tail protein X
MRAKQIAGTFVPFFSPSVTNAVYLAQAVVDFGLAERGNPSGGEADWAQPKRRRPRAAPTLRNRCFRTTTTTSVAHAAREAAAGLSGWGPFFRRKTCVSTGGEDGLGFALGPGVLSINIQRCHFHAVMSSARATQEPLDTSARPVYSATQRLTLRQSAGSGLESSLPHHWTLKSRRYRVCDLTSRPTNRHVHLHLHACMYNNYTKPNRVEHPTPTPARRTQYAQDTTAVRYLYRAPAVSNV